MLERSDLVCFSATRDAARAREFYGRLGLELRAETPHALVFDANGTMLRVQKVEVLSPPAHTVLGWQVKDVRATLRDLASLGLTCERFECVPQDGDGVWSTPDGAQVAWLRDPDGNLLSLTQPAP